MIKYISMLFLILFVAQSFLSGSDINNEQKTEQIQEVQNIANILADRVKARVLYMFKNNQIENYTDLFVSKKYPLMINFVNTQDGPLFFSVKYESRRLSGDYDVFWSDGGYKIEDIKQIPELKSSVNSDTTKVCAVILNGHFTCEGTFSINKKPIKFLKTVITYSDLTSPCIFSERSAIAYGNEVYYYKSGKWQYFGTAMSYLSELMNTTETMTEPLLPASNSLEYPENLKLQDAEGTLLLDLTINPDSTVAKCQVRKSSFKGNDELLEYTVQNIKKWKFIPAYYGEDPTSSQATLSVTYKLQDSKAKIQFVDLDEEVESEESGTTPKFVVYDEAPAPIKFVNPDYPIASKRLSIQGQVILVVEVLASGKVGAVEVKKSLQSGPDGLDEAAVAAIKQWKYKPAKRKGKPVACWVTFPVDFSLEK